MELRWHEFRLFIGFSVAGHYELTQNYTSLFIFATLGNGIAIVLAVLNWAALKDLNTPLLSATPQQFKTRLLVGILIMIGVIPVVLWNLKNADFSRNLVISVGVFIAAVLIVVTLRHPDRREKTICGLIWCWPSARWFFGRCTKWLRQDLICLLTAMSIGVCLVFEIAPQWVQNLNTTVIMIGGPLLAIWFQRLRSQGWKIDIPQQFSASLILIGIGF